MDPYFQTPNQPPKTNWFSNHHLLGYVFLILVTAAILSVIYYWQISEQNPVEIPQHQKSEVQTYTNSDYGFEVKYDKQYILSTSGDQENYFRTNGKTLATIALPQNSYPNTNFGSADATFAVRENTSESDCALYMYSAGSALTMKETMTINGNKAYHAEFDGAAAGTRYATQVYHLSRNNTCFEINLTAGIANIGNYESGTAIEVNETEVWNKLDVILNTFKFTK